MMRHLFPLARTMVAVVVVAAGLAACTSRATTPGDFWIETAEATQGTQLVQQVPLIANKRTFVRVTLSGNPDNFGVLPTVQVALYVSDISTLDPTNLIRPLNRTTLTVPRSGGTTGINATRWTLEDSFVFELPAEATTAGSRRVGLIAYLPGGSPPRPLAGSEPGRKGLTLDLRFGPTGTTLALPVYAVRYGYHNVPPVYQSAVGLSGPDWPAHDWAALDRMRPLAENLLPVASIRFEQLPKDGDVDCRYAPSPSGGIGGCLGYDDARAWAADIIDRLWDAGGARIVVLQPESQPGHNSAHFTTKAGNHVIMVQEEIKDAIDTGLALARGLGFSAGLCDPNAAGCVYPRAGGALGPYTGLRYWPGLATVAGEEPLGTSVAYDLMQPGGNPAWISPYNYCRAMAGLWSARLACPGSLDHALLTSAP